MQLKSNTELMILATVLALFIAPAPPLHAQNPPNTPNTPTIITLPPDIDPISAIDLINEAQNPQSELEPTPQQIELLTKLQNLLDQTTPPTATPSEVTTSGGLLDNIAAAARELESQAPPAPLHLRAISVRMQALYLHATQFPTDARADARLARLQIAARQTKTIDEPTAPALGDFWLLMADIHDINRSGLPLKDRSAQTRQLLASYQATYKTAPTLAAVRNAMRQIDNPPLPSPTPTTPAITPNQTVSIETPATTATSPPTTPQTPGATTPKVLTPGAGAITPGAITPGAITPGAPSIPNSNPIFKLSELHTDDHNITHYNLASRFQPAPNTLRVLLPDAHPAPAPRRILFLLPVEAANGDAFGDPLLTFLKLDLHNTLGLIVVAPTFSQTPWYADHPTNVTLMQESYFTRAVVPAMDQLFPAQKPKRLLLGFSKSGWGAISMLLRHPELFDAAASWDAPLMLDAPDKFNMEHIFTNPVQFDRYNLTHQFRDKARLLRKSLRIAILGYDYFAEDLHRAHSLLEQLNIPHLYTDGPERTHRWDSGWLNEATQALHLMTNE